MNNKPPVVKYSFNLNTGFTTESRTSASNNNINLNTCHYCNIDFINTIEQRYQFKSIKDFILNAPYEVLMLVKEIKKDFEI